MNNALFLMFGFLVFSSLGSTLLIKYLNFPMSAPELLAIPFAFVLHHKITSIELRRKDILLASTAVGGLLTIGLLYGRFSLYAMLSSSRSWLYMMICTFAFSRPNKITNNDLMWLSLGSIIAWLIDSLMNYQELIRTAIEGEEVVTYGLMLAVPVLFASSIHRRRYFVLFLSIFIIGITVVFAGIRRLLAVAMLSLLIAIVIKIFTQKKQLISILTLCVVVSVIIGLSLPLIGQYVKETSPTMYYRVFERTGQFLESGHSGSTGDAVRLNNFKQLANEIGEYTIPHGMISVQTQSDESTGVFNDFPLYQLCWIFSWPLVLFLLYHIGLLLYKNYRKYRMMRDELSSVSIVSIIVMLMLLFLEGTYIEYPYATPITGILLGRAILNTKTNSIIQ